MRKRAAKKPPDVRERDSQPWLQVVDSIRRKADPQRYRLRILSGLGRWIDFASAWSASGVPVLQRAYPRDSVYHGPIVLDEMNYWAWQTIERTGAVDAALEIVNEAAPISSLEVINIFESMRLGLLLFPDGSINTLAMAQINDVVQADLSRVSIRANTRIIKNIQTTAALERLTNKHGN